MTINTDVIINTDAVPVDPQPTAATSLVALGSAATPALARGRLLSDHACRRRD